MRGRALVPRKTKVPRGTKPCKCGAVRDRPGQSYCRVCHNAYMRAFRARARARHAAMDAFYRQQHQAEARA